MSRGGRNRRKSRDHDRNPQQQRSEGRQKDWNRNPQKQRRGKRRRREEEKPQQQARQPQAEPQSLADRFRKGKETQEVARVERQKRWAKGRVGDVAEKVGRVAEAARPVVKAAKVVGKAAVQAGKAAAPHVKVAGVAVVKALDKATAPPKSGKRPQFPDMLGDREPRRGSSRSPAKRIERPVWSMDMGMGPAPSTSKKKKGKKLSTTLDLNQGGLNFNF
jgi:hypothetical protein